MNSGKRARVMVACVTFETYKISNPVAFYEIDRVHLIHFVQKPDSENGQIYQQFYDRTVELIKATGRDVEIVEHCEDVNDFSTMMRTLSSIMEAEFQHGPSADVFINTSAGSAEYTAASTIAAMMYPASIPFAVKTTHYTTEGMVKDIFFKDGVPVGQTAATEDPKALPKYHLERPDRNLVLGLRILKLLSDRQPFVRSPRIISALKDNGLWFRGEWTADGQHSGQTRIESVYYYRDFVAKWLANDWVFQDQHGRRYLLTDEGRAIIGMFFVDDKLILD